MKNWNYESLIQLFEKKEFHEIAQLIKNGAPVNQLFFGDQGAGCCNISPIMLAAQYGDIELVRLMLQKDAQPDFVNTCLGDTAMIIAARKGYTEIIKLLDEHNADLNGSYETNGSHHTPLQKAAKYGHYETVNYLLEQGAKPELADFNNNSPISLALEHHHPTIAELIAPKLSQPQLIDDLIRAIGLNSLQGVKLVLKHIKNINVHAERSGELAIIVALGLNVPHKQEMIQLLRVKGADLKTRNKQGTSAQDIITQLNIDLMDEDKYE